MSAIDLITAKEHLAAWLLADLKVSTGKIYKMGSREMTRANVAEIQERINYWRAEVSRLQRGGGLRVRRFVPRDL